ncbi:MAG: GAF domain-containing protein [Chloroflexia bacterium]|nr:GAF domain-containing protein [Chloroflexia bacterium]
MSTHDDGPENRGDQDARFVEELRRALTRALAAETLAAESPTEDVLDLAVRTAARAIPSPEGALLLVDPAAGELTFEIAIGATAEKVKDIRLPMGRGIAGLVAMSGQPLAVADAQADPRHARDVAEQVGYLPNTILAVPVISAVDPDRVLGVVELLDRQGQPTYSLADMELLGIFARQIASILDHRRATHSLAMLVGEALGGLAGLAPDARRVLTDRMNQLASGLVDDPLTRRTLTLARLVEEIARYGEAEQQACTAVLESFAAYLRERPRPGGLHLAGRR